MTFSEAAMIMMSKNKNIVMTERVKAIDEAPILTAGQLFWYWVTGNFSLGTISLL